MSDSASRFMLSAALGVLLALTLAGTALATHPRPGTGSPFRVPLVNAFEPCGAPDAGHASGQPSCSPAPLLSPLLKSTSTGVMSGFVKMTVFCAPPSVGSPATSCSDVAGDQEDIAIEGEVTDVSCAMVGPFCGGGPGVDYTGPVVLNLPTRLTDHANTGAPCPGALGAPPCKTATLRDNLIGIPTTCAPMGVPTSAPGSKCSWGTTLDSNLPGEVLELQRGNLMHFGNVNVVDPGGDGSFGPMCPPICGTADERITRVQGLFTP